MKQRRNREDYRMMRRGFLTSIIEVRIVFDLAKSRYAPRQQAVIGKREVSERDAGYQIALPWVYRRKIQ
jgi:hypothetical protein